LADVCVRLTVIHWHRSLHVQGIGLDRAKLAELHDLGLSLYSARSTLLVRGTHR